MATFLPVTYEAFEAIVSEAIDALPLKYRERLDNVVFVTSEKPSDVQRQKMHLTNHQTLFGLYEGIPQTARGANYSLVLPDKITIFMQPILFASRSLEDVKSHTRKTVWHEVAHHFGLHHEDIERLGGS